MLQLKKILIISLMFFITSLLAVTCLNAADHSRTDTVFRQLSAQIVKRVATSAGLAPKARQRSDKRPAFVLDYGNFNGNLILDGCGRNGQCTGLTLLGFFSGSSASLEAVNSWNSNGAYVTAYLSDDKDLVVAYWLDVKAGVTLQNINQFLSTYKSGVVAVAKKVSAYKK